MSEALKTAVYEFVSCHDQKRKELHDELRRVSMDAVQAFGFLSNRNADSMSWEAAATEFLMSIGNVLQVSIDHAGLLKASEADALYALHHLDKRYETHDKSDPDVRAAVLALTDGRCAYCDVRLTEGTRDLANFAVEHVVPVSKGGPDNIANYVPSCQSCNASKNVDHVLAFIKRRRNVVAMSHEPARRMMGETE